MDASSSGYLFLLELVLGAGTSGDRWLLSLLPEGRFLSRFQVHNKSYFDFAGVRPSVLLSLTGVRRMSILYFRTGDIPFSKRRVRNRGAHPDSMNDSSDFRRGGCLKLKNRDAFVRLSRQRTRDKRICKHARKF